MKTTLSDPTPLCLSLFVQYEENIEKARRLFFDHMIREYGSHIGAKVQEKFLLKVNSSTSPLQGEMLPWFLLKLFPPGTIHESKTKWENKLIAWYALYMAVVVVDDTIDQDMKTDFEILMPLIAEAGPHLIETKYSRRAVNGQINDMHKKPNGEKNAFIGALINQMFEENGVPNFRLRNFLLGREVLELFQFLDDIADADWDFRHQHPSILFTKKMIDSGHSTFSMDELPHNKKSFEKLFTLCKDKNFSLLIERQFRTKSAVAREFVSHLLQRQKEVGVDYSIDFSIEIDYFKNLAHELQVFATYISNSIEQDPFPEIEFKQKLKVFAHSS